MRIKPTATLVQSIVLACSLLISGCSQVAVSTNTTITTVNTSSTTTAEVTTTTTYNAADYPFTWDYYASLEFDEYLKNKLQINVSKYVIYYGFTDELNNIFTAFCNKKYGLDCKSVPFKKANYFLDTTTDGTIYHNLSDDYDYFKLVMLDKENVRHGPFANKLIMSYMVQNKIPFGTRIPLDNLKSLMGDEVYTYDIGLKETIKDPKIGTYPSSHRYTNGQLFGALRKYNSFIYYLCVDYSIKSGNPQDDISVFAKCNEHLKKFYGENAPQIGEIMSPEQYEKIWGEKPLDISYIPGALINLPIVIANPDGSITEIK